MLSKLRTSASTTADSATRSTPSNTHSFSRWAGRRQPAETIPLRAWDRAQQSGDPSVKATHFSVKTHRHTLSYTDERATICLPTTIIWLQQEHMDVLILRRATFLLPAQVGLELSQVAEGSRLQYIKKRYTTEPKQTGSHPNSTGALRLALALGRLHSGLFTTLCPVLEEERPCACRKRLPTVPLLVHAYFFQCAIASSNSKFGS